MIFALIRLQLDVFRLKLDEIRLQLDVIRLQLIVIRLKLDVIRLQLDGALVPHHQNVKASDKSASTNHVLHFIQHFDEEIRQKFCVQTLVDEPLGELFSKQRVVYVVPERFLDLLR